MENNTTNPINNTLPPLPTTVELCTLCTMFTFKNLQDLLENIPSNVSNHREENNQEPIAASLSFS